MNDSLNKQNSTTYKDILLNDFPEALTADVNVVFNILPLNINAVTLINDQIFTSSNLIHPSSLAGKFKRDLLSIPDRIYFSEPGQLLVSQLTPTQKAILNCIYLRHHNGYVRQRRLEGLAGVNEDWIIPHTLQLLGDYVVEILQVLDKLITDENIQYYRQFIKDNPRHWQQTVSRMVSYWDCYYRRKHFQDDMKNIFPEFKDYPGKQIVDRLELVNLK
jgi:hypothetical protein